MPSPKRRLDDRSDACPRCGKLVGRKKDGTYRKHTKNGGICTP